MYKPVVVEFTSEEQALVDVIRWNDYEIPNGVPDEFWKECDLVKRLIMALRDRDAIPRERWDCIFEIPYDGRLSYYQQFVENGGPEMALCHPRFRRHLRFLFYGAELPIEVKTAVATQVGRDEHEAGKIVRESTRGLVRSGRAEHYELPEQFLKFAHEMGRPDLADRFRSWCKAAKP